MEKITGVIIFGDSVLAGTGASDRQLGCAKLVKNALSIPISIKSRNRDTSSTGLMRIHTDVLPEQTLSHVIILFGNNDCWLDTNGQPSVPVKDFGDNLKKMIQLIKKNGQTPILCDLQPINNDCFFRSFPQYLKFRDSTNLNPLLWQENYNCVILSICNEGSHPLVKIREELKKNIPAVISEDGIHPNNSGHQIIADRILSELQRMDPSLTTSESST